jgi:tetratricopeptide (TPR) repeat protein
MAYSPHSQISLDFSVQNFRKKASRASSIRLNPKLAFPHLNRGLSHARKGEYAEAIADYTEAILLDSKYAEAYAHRAEAYRALGDQAKAASDEKKAQELSK